MSYHVIRNARAVRGACTAIFDNCTGELGLRFTQSFQGCRPRAVRINRRRLRQRRKSEYELIRMAAWNQIHHWERQFVDSTAAGQRYRTQCAAVAIEDAYLRIGIEELGQIQYVAHGRDGSERSL